jgi:hypothetical protein
VSQSNIPGTMKERVRFGVVDLGGEVLATFIKPRGSQLGEWQVATCMTFYPVLSFGSRAESIRRGW